MADTFREYMEDIRFRKAVEKARIEHLNKHIINGNFSINNKGELEWNKKNSKKYWES